MLAANWIGSTWLCVRGGFIPIGRFLSSSLITWRSVAAGDTEISGSGTGGMTMQERRQGVRDRYNE